MWMSILRLEFPRKHYEKHKKHYYRNISQVGARFLHLALPGVRPLPLRQLRHCKLLTPFGRHRELQTMVRGPNPAYETISSGRNENLSIMKN